MADDPAENRVRRHVIYHGRVQGVCFRAVAEEIAGGFPVTGYVRNLRDGTVELQAEGAASAVNDFLAAVARYFKHNITRAEVQEITPRRDETAFEIRY